MMPIPHKPETGHSNHPSYITSTHSDWQRVKFEKNHNIVYSAHGFQEWILLTLLVRCNNKLNSGPFYPLASSINNYGVDLEGNSN